MLIYNTSIFKTKLGYFKLTSKKNKIISFYPYNKENIIKLSNNILHINFLNFIQNYFDNKKSKLKFSIDFKGTFFENLVWKEICKIRYGQTKSYAEIANKIESSPRAVGNACAKNQCLLIIPCHRVIRSDGTYGKYVLGNKIKEQLIKLESYGK